MCNCTDRRFNDNSNNIVSDSVVIYSPQDKLVRIDVCILKEIQALWKAGIETTGCCCGHNIGKDYIRVKDKDIIMMEVLCYVHREHPYMNDPTNNTFYPQST